MKGNSFIKWNIIFLTSLLILSGMAYMIIPDNTPYANDQHSDVALRPPMFSTKIIKLSADETVTDKGFLQSLISGKEHDYSYLPFKELKEDNESIKITNHINRTQLIPLTDLYHGNSLSANITDKRYWLGTDKFGRCILSRLVLGVRVSIFIGFAAVLISLVIGVTLGAIAGYYGGMIDQIISYVISVTWSIPTLLMVFIIVLALGRGIGVIFLAIGLTMWVDVARIVRGQMLSIKNQDYIKATKVLHVSDRRVIIKHVLPNLISSILVIAASNFAIAILVEAGLSYLGFGIQPPAPSLGNMLYENYGYAISGKIYLAIIPAITIMMLVLSFNLLGTGLRDIFDVKSKKTL